MVEQNPSDGFRRYATGDGVCQLRGSVMAVDEFLKLLDHNPNYAAAYFHGAQTLEKMGRVDEAKGLYRRGIEVTSALGDDHTCGELQAALDMLG